MTTHENFTKWLEGFLDACKNKPTAQQIKEIRKKISEIQSVDSRHAFDRSPYTPLWDSNSTTSEPFTFSTIGLVPLDSKEPNNGPLDEEFIAAIEKNKSASTMEELAD